MSSFGDVVKSVVSDAVASSAGRVLTERSQKLLSDISNVVEKVAEDSAKLGASAIIKTEDCVINALKPSEIEKSFLRTLSEPSEYRSPTPTSPKTPSDDQYKTVESIGPIEDEESGWRTPSHQSPKRGAPLARRAHPSTALSEDTPPGVTRKYLTRRRPTAHCRSLLNEECKLFSEKRGSFFSDNLDEHLIPNREQMDTREISVNSKSGAGGKFVGSSVMLRSSGYLPLEKFSKKPMPNKRFDGFMTEPRRPRAPAREEGVMSARSFVHRGAGAGGGVATPVKGQENSSALAETHTLSTSTQISLEDNNLYPCPEGVLIFPAPKIILSQEVSTPPSINKPDVHRKPKID